MIGSSTTKYFEELNQSYLDSTAADVGVMN